jgi:hypothetical protein
MRLTKQATAATLLVGRSIIVKDKIETDISKTRKRQNKAHGIPKLLLSSSSLLLLNCVSFLYYNMVGV